MEQVTLVCDIGNTNIKFGIAQRECGPTWSLPSKLPYTSDSLGLQLAAFFKYFGVDRTSCKACAVVSVVPALNQILRDAVYKYLGLRSFFIMQDIPVPLANHYERPAEVGPDRLLASWAARTLYPEFPSTIIVDFGTAVTFDCAQGQTYLGGLIFPGPEAATAALSLQTAKLPHIGLGTPPDTLTPCRDTATSMQHGILYGYAALTEGICKKLRVQLAEPVVIVGTGGFTSVIDNLGNLFDYVVPNLLLDGLSRLFQEHNSHTR